MSVRKAALDLDVLVAVAERAQFLPERLKKWLKRGARPAVKKADPAARRRLCAGGARQQQRPAAGKNKTPRRRLSGAHSITSSARARIDGGIVRPSARAVFRLMTNSNLVGCSTGRSAGLAPL